MEKRQDSFVFYASFFEALQGCPDDIRLAVYEEIMKYALYNYEPTIEGIGKSLFTLIRPQLDANRKRREAGAKGADFGKLGGRPKKPQENPKQTPKKPQENPQKTPNVNVNVNDNVNDNVNILTNVSNTLTRKSQFENWLTTNCPYIAKHYTLPTDEQLDKLCNQYGAQLVAETTQQIENRADLRKKYTNLYRTLLNWLKRETDKSMSYDERERQKRIATYANVAEQFLNGEIRNDIPIPFGMEH